MSAVETFPSDPSETPQLVVAGGGSGTSVMAAGLAESMPDASVTALVSMSDSGGSTGALRELFNVGPVGDVRKCISALSPYNDAATLFEQRLDRKATIDTVTSIGQSLLTSLVEQHPHLDQERTVSIMKSTAEVATQLPRLHGHTFGNLVVTSLAIEHGDIDMATAEAGQLLNIRGRVIPVTKQSHELMMDDGHQIVLGEANIDTHHVADPEQAEIWLSPSAQINSRARQAVERADALLIGPGSVFTSLLPVLAVQGMREAIARVRGSVVAVVNPITQGHETGGWDVADYLRKLESYTHRPFDYVLYNTVHDALPEAEEPVVLNRDRFAELEGTRVAIGADLIDAQHEAAYDANDVLAALRSRVHYDPRVVARVLDERILHARV